MSIAVLVVAPAILFGSTHPDPWVIVPGVSVGSVRIGSQSAPVLARFAKSSAVPGRVGDTAMGHSWCIFAGRHGHELDLYTVRGENDSAAHPEDFIRQVRITSPSFHLANGIRVGVSLSLLRRSIPHLVLAKQKGPITLFDSEKSGVAFEIQNGRCAAILVHPKDSGVLREYMPFQDYQ
jgi:hypothetical protein